MIVKLIKGILCLTVLAIWLAGVQTFILADGGNTAPPADASASEAYKRIADAFWPAIGIISETDIKTNAKILATLPAPQTHDITYIS